MRSVGLDQYAHSGGAYARVCKLRLILVVLEEILAFSIRAALRILLAE